jgi:hypothetical protein
MAAEEPNRMPVSVEPSSWRPLISIILAAVSVYAVLAVVLIHSATNAGPRGLLWLTVPAVLVVAAVAALVISSVSAVRERFVALASWYIGRDPGSEAHPSAQGFSDAARNT